MEAAFRLVLTTSLYASIVGVVILILKTLLKNKINPKWHYIIWVILVLKLLVPFGPESSLSLFNAVPKVPEQINFSEKHEEPDKPTDSLQQEKPAIPDAGQVHEVPLSFTVIAGKAMPYIWLFGIVLMIGWLLFINCSFCKRLKKSGTRASETINSIFEYCKNKADIRKNIEIVVQEEINTPAVFGVLHPKILLPSAILNLADKEISYILLHELAHYKRKDLLANYLLLMLQAVHWFNPVIWYCFKKIREDMEVAADERALALLNDNERKEYGKALVAVLESYNLPRFAPRLIGMVDDRKNIERRIKMIKMTEFFKKRRKLVLVTGVICMVILGAVLLTSGLSKRDPAAEPEKSSAQSKDYNAAALLKFKTAYVGDHVKVGNILNNLPFSNFAKEGFSLKTDEKPYGISLKYKFSGSSLNKEAIEATFRNNVVVMFALIDNVDEISFSSNFLEEEQKYTYTRAELQKSYVKDLKEYAKDAETFEILLNSLSLKFLQSQNPKTIDEAVSLAIKAQGKGYGSGEVSTEGHVILDTEENKGKVKVYTIASYGAFGFENGIFTKVSGSGAIPTVMTFSKNEKGEYLLQKYKEPEDGTGYGTSKKRMFPQRLWDKVFSEQKYYPDLAKQQEEQAKQYLQTIGRNAKVSAASVEKKLIKINVDASNKLFAELTKYDTELNNFPYWIGTRELFEKEVRYIYETSQSKTSDGFDLILFRKRKEGGTVVKEYRYKIVGSEPRLVK